MAQGRGPGRDSKETKVDGVFSKQQWFRRPEDREYVSHRAWDYEGHLVSH